MPALWVTASTRPSLLTSSATVIAPAMVARSPETTPRAPAAAASASRLRPSFRPCNTTSWPWSTRSRAAMRPRPSDDPVINTRATPAPPLIAPTYRPYDPKWSPCAPGAFLHSRNGVRHLLEGGNPDSAGRLLTDIEYLVGRLGRI